MPADKRNRLCRRGSSTTAYRLLFLDESTDRQGIPATARLFLQALFIGSPVDFANPAGGFKTKQVSVKSPGLIRDRLKTTPWSDSSRRQSMTRENWRSSQPALIL